MLRTYILSRLVCFGDVDTICEARSRFKKHVKGELSLSPDIRSAVYRAIAASEGESGFEQLIAVCYNNSKINNLFSDM